RLFSFWLGTRGGFHALVGQIHRGSNEARERGLAGQVGKLGDAAELAEFAVLFFRAGNQPLHLGMPEVDAAMLLEGGHGDEISSAVDEMRAAPLERFVNVFAGGVNRTADILQNWARERSGIGDVFIDARVF